MAFLCPVFLHIKSGILGSIKQRFNFIAQHFTELSISKGLCDQDDLLFSQTQALCGSTCYRPIHDIHSVTRLFWWADFPTFSKVCEMSALLHTALNIQLSRNLTSSSQANKHLCGVHLSLIWTSHLLPAFANYTVCKAKRTKTKHKQPPPSKQLMHSLTCSVFHTHTLGFFE